MHIGRRLERRNVNQVGPERPHVVRRLLLAFVSADSYGLVLLLIIVTYSLAVAADPSWGPLLVALVQIVTVWFALRTSRSRREVRIVASVILAATAVIAVLEVSVGDPNDPSPWIFAASGVLYLIAPTAMIRHLAMRRVVDQETVLGAVAAYLMIGMFFAFAYRFLELAQAGPFFGTAGERNMDQVLFFSFTTLTTTGYGNLVPEGNPGQSLAVAEMLIGQLFLITAISKVVTAWRPARWSTQDVPMQDRRV
jgi:Ion channel